MTRRDLDLGRNALILQNPGASKSSGAVGSSLFSGKKADPYIIGKLAG